VADSSLDPTTESLVEKEWRGGMLGARGGDTDQVAASSSTLSFSCALERSSAWRSPAISARISSGESEPASCACGGGWGSEYGDG
jgi:hypothetical protein